MSTAVISKPADETPSGGRAARLDLAGLYAGGAVVCGIVAALLGGVGSVFAWPALSLAAVAWTYAMGWSWTFGKRRGRLPVWSYIAFGPYLLGQRTSWWLQSRSRTPCSQLLSNLWIGRMPTAQDCVELKDRGVTATLDLTAEFSETRALRGTSYHNLPILDLTLPDLPTLRHAVELIDEASQNGGIVYLHCALGYGRSAVVAAAYLLSTSRAATVEQAAGQIRACRPGSVFPPRALALLEQFHTSLW